MAARVDQKGRFQTVLKRDDYSSLLAFLNLCLENIKASFLLTVANKKTSEQLKETNELLVKIEEVIILMEEFQLKLLQDIILNEKWEEMENLEKQIDEIKIRLEELQKLYLIQQSQEIANSIKALAVINKLNELALKLMASDNKITFLQTRLVDLNSSIGNKLQNIIHDVVDAHPPFEFIYEDHKYQITKQEITEGLRKEFQKEIDNGTFNIENTEW